MPAKTEQRRSYRYGVKFPCSVKCSRGPQEPAESEIQTETRDVSTGGLYFEASADWGIGTEIECLLHLPVKAFGGRPVAIRCRGKIARVTAQEPGRIGVGATIEHFEFLHLDKSKAKEALNEKKGR